LTRCHPVRLVFNLVPGFSASLFARGFSLRICEKRRLFFQLLEESHRRGEPLPKMVIAPRSSTLRDETTAFSWSAKGKKETS